MPPYPALWFKISIFKPFNFKPFKNSIKKKKPITDASTDVELEESMRDKIYILILPGREGRGECLRNKLILKINYLVIRN